ncbi:hypothetical protein T439DRAFT_112751 [Meredithblackwellia eburnea MCA 4105]
MEDISRVTWRTRLRRYCCPRSHSSTHDEALAEPEPTWIHRRLHLPLNSLARQVVLSRPITVIVALVYALSAVLLSLFFALVPVTPPDLDCVGGERTRLRPQPPTRNAPRRSGTVKNGSKALVEGQDYISATGNLSSITQTSPTLDNDDENSSNTPDEPAQASGIVSFWNRGLLPLRRGPRRAPLTPPHTIRLKEMTPHDLEDVLESDEGCFSEGEDEEEEEEEMDSLTADHGSESDGPSEVDTISDTVAPQLVLSTGTGKGGGITGGLFKRRQRKRASRESSEGTPASSSVEDLSSSSSPPTPGSSSSSNKLGLTAIACANRAKKNNSRAISPSSPRLPPHPSIPGGPVRSVSASSTSTSSYSSSTSSSSCPTPTKRPFFRSSKSTPELPSSPILAFSSEPESFEQHGLHVRFDFTASPPSMSRSNSSDSGGAGVQHHSTLPPIITTCSSSSSSSNASPLSLSGTSLLTPAPSSTTHSNNSTTTPNQPRRKFTFKSAFHRSSSPSPTRSPSRSRDRSPITSPLASPRLSPVLGGTGTGGGANGSPLPLVVGAGKEMVDDSGRSGLVLSDFRDEMQTVALVGSRVAFAGVGVGTGAGVGVGRR